MKSILAVKSNHHSLSQQPTIIDELINDLSTSNQFGEINYHDNDWYSVELEKKLGNNIQSFLETSIFLELVSAQFLLIDAINNCDKLLTNRHLFYLDYLANNNVFKYLSKDIEVIIFISTKHFNTEYSDLSKLINSLPDHIFKDIFIVNIYDDLYLQNNYLNMKSYILDKAA